MTPHAFHLPVQMGELLDDSHPLSLEDLARACHRAPEWVVARVEAGVIESTAPGGQTTRVMPSSRATAQACTGPAPPVASSA